MFDHKNVLKLNYIKNKMRNFQRQSQTEIQLTFECSFQYNFFLLKTSKRTMKLLEALIFCASILTMNEKRSKKESTKWCIDMFDVYIYMTYVCNLSSNE